MSNPTNFKAHLTDIAGLCQITIECLACKRRETTLKHLESLLASDSFAVQFQTLGQYRTALLAELKKEWQNEPT